MNSIKKSLPLLAISALFLVLALAPELAQAAVEEKINTILDKVQTILKGIGGAIITIGLLLAGMKFIKGDPDATNTLVKIGIGGVIIFAAGEIASLFA